MVFMTSRKQFFLGIWFVVVAVLYYYHQRGSLTVEALGRINIESLTDTFAQLWPAAEQPAPKPAEQPAPQRVPTPQPRQAPKELGPDRRTPAPYPQDRQGVRLIAKRELKQHGPNGPLSPVWLSILGQVYNVDKGKDSYYGPNGGYNFFSGRDGTRAFVSGNFTEDGLIEDIYGLSPKECQDLKNWARDTYDKDYIFVGKLIGGFYDENGEPTEMHHELERQVEKAQDIDALLKKEEQQFPPCNSRWNAREGGWVYCGKKRLVRNMHAHVHSMAVLWEQVP